MSEILFGVTFMGQNRSPIVKFATNNVKIVLKNVAGGNLLAIASHNFNSFLLIAIENEVVSLGKLSIARTNYTVLIKKIRCSSILIINTVAQNAKTMTLVCKS